MVSLIRFWQESVPTLLIVARTRSKLRYFVAFFPQQLDRAVRSHQVAGADNYDRVLRALEQFLKLWHPTRRAVRNQLLENRRRIRPRFIQHFFQRHRIPVRQASTISPNNFFSLSMSSKDFSTSRFSSSLEKLVRRPI